MNESIGFIAGLLIGAVLLGAIMRNEWMESSLKAGVATYVCDQATGDCRFTFKKECK